MKYLNVFNIMQLFTNYAHSVSRAWKKKDTEDALKCWNLERVIDAGLLGQPAPNELTMEEFLKEGQGPSKGNNGDEVVVVD